MKFAKYFILFIWIGLLSLVTSEAAFAQSFCVKKDGAKLFADADSKSKSFISIPIYTPLLGSGKKKLVKGSTWVEVSNSESAIFWTPRFNLTTKWNCLEVYVNHSKLRIGPGADFDTAKNAPAKNMMCS